MEIDNSTMKALNTKTRQDIVRMLTKRPYTASELSRILGKHVTTVSEHLEVLERAGIAARRDSTNKWVYYSLTHKGEGIFNPTKMWTLVLSLSFVSMLAGLIFSGGYFAASNQAMTTDAYQKSAESAQSGAASMPTPAIYINMFSIILTGLGLLGIAYVTIKYLRVKALQKQYLSYK